MQIFHVFVFCVSVFLFNKSSSTFLGELVKCIFVVVDSFSAIKTCWKPIAIFHVFMSSIGTRVVLYFSEATSKIVPLSIACKNIVFSSLYDSQCL